MQQFFSFSTTALEVPMRALYKCLAGTPMVLAVTLFTINCNGGGPTDPPNGCEPNCPSKTSIAITSPVDGLTVAENDTIFCERPTITPPSTGLGPDWWLKGDSDWLRAR